MREAIERMDTKSLSAQFRMFPGGACGAASDVLGTYLDELGYTPIYRVLRYFRTTGQKQSHVWLEYDNLLIDITADQFNNHPEIGTIFGFKDSIHVTEDHTKWYNVFNYDNGFEERQKSHYRKFGESDAAILIERDYLSILKHISKDHWPDLRK